MGAQVGQGLAHLSCQLHPTACTCHQLRATPGACMPAGWTLSTVVLRRHVTAIVLGGPIYPPAARSDHRIALLHTLQQRPGTCSALGQGRWRCDDARRKYDMGENSAAIQAMHHSKGCLPPVKAGCSASATSTSVTTIFMLAGFSLAYDSSPFWKYAPLTTAAARATLAAQ